MNKVHTINDIGLSAINKQMGCFIKLSGKTGTFKHSNMFENEMAGSNFNAFCLISIYLYIQWIVSHLTLMRCTASLTSESLLPSVSISH